MQCSRWAERQCLPAQQCPTLHGEKGSAWLALSLLPSSLSCSMTVRAFVGHWSCGAGRRVVPKGTEGAGRRGSLWAWPHNSESRLLRI